MIQLTSVQEAAFNAAGEAMSDLFKEDKLTFHLARSKYESNPEKIFQAFSTDTKSPLSVWGHGPTASAAVVDLIRAVEEENNAPPKLVTAKEAIAAAKEVITQQTVHTAEHDAVIAALDALPVE